MIDEEVKEIHDKVIKQIKKKLGISNKKAKMKKNNMYRGIRKDFPDLSDLDKADKLKKLVKNI